MKRFWAGVLAFCMIAALSACKGTSADPQAETPDAGQEDAYSVPELKSPVEGAVVALIPRTSDEAFYIAAKNGAQRYAAQWGLEIRSFDEGITTAAAQAEAIRQAVEEHVNGICISVIDAEVVHAALRDARDAGVCVTTWDSDAAPEERTLMVSQGTASVMGSMLAEMGAASLKERGVDPAGEVAYLWIGGGEENAENAVRYAAAREYIRKNYPNWIELDAPYVCAAEAPAGEKLLEDYGQSVSLILCGTDTALKDQCAAALACGRSAGDLTITGFCAPSEMTDYLKADVCRRWGLWDCGMQSAMGCYLAAWLAEGNEVHVGDVVGIPRIGSVEILANSVLAEEAETAEANSGVVLLPERIVFTAENVDDFTF